MWERQTWHSLTFPRSQRYPQCCAEFMWLLHFKSRNILIFCFRPSKQTKSFHADILRALPPAVHADCLVPKEEVSHTSDNSYHPGVSHVGFPWHSAANPMQTHTWCSFKLKAVVRMNRNETLRSPCLSREIAFRVDTDSRSAIYCS